MTVKFMPTVATRPTTVTPSSTTGVSRTKRSPSPRFSKTSRTEPGRGTRRAICRSLSRIIRRPMMTATKLAALIANAVAMPNRPIVKPATAGPTTRAPLNIAEFSATALPTSRGPTIS